MVKNCHIFIFFNLNFVVLPGGATVELQLCVRVIALIFFTHPGDKGEVLVVLHPERPGEQEVDKPAVFEGEAEVVAVAQPEGVGLDRGGFDDAVEVHPFTLVFLEDPGGDQLGAVLAAKPFSNLRQKK